MVKETPWETGADVATTVVVEWMREQKFSTVRDAVLTLANNFNATNRTLAYIVRQVMGTKTTPASVASIKSRPHGSGSRGDGYSGPRAAWKEDDGGRSEALEDAASNSKMREDCTVRALAAFVDDVTYEEAFDLITAHVAVNRRADNFGKNLGARTYEYGPVYQAHGLEYHKLSRPMMLSKAAARFGDGIYHVGRHVVAVRDGKLLDTFDSRRKMAKGVWKMGGPV